ncbi:hypothetical protein [Nocardia sp. NPDC049149]|uniref:hypothetical protein n=1 Tax=Nocardia sp. NPDC049149 TaxID=3364315 RepID=UPI00371DE69B
MSFEPRHLTALPPLTVDGHGVKRYEISVAPTGVPAPIAESAYTLLPELLPAPGPYPSATFTVLHRSLIASYLLAYTWTHSDILILRKAVAGAPDLGAPDDDPAHFATTTADWIGCVWELGPLEHERSSWVRHVLSPAEPDLAAYLADFMTAAFAGAPTTPPAQIEATISAFPS